MTVKIVTDPDSYSTATTVDDGTLASISVVNNRIRLASITDTVVSDKVGNLVDVTLNDRPVDQLSYASSSPIQRVFFNHPTLTGSGVCTSVCTFKFDWFRAYAEAPVTNGEVTYYHKIVRVSNGAVWREGTAQEIVPDVGAISDEWTVSCPEAFSLVVAKMSTADGWQDIGLENFTVPCG